MQKYEKTISFNNRYFIFKKVSNVNVDNVLKSEKSETEEDNIKIQLDSSVKEKMKQQTKTKINQNQKVRNLLIRKQQQKQVKKLLLNVQEN